MATTPIHDVGTSIGPYRIEELLGRGGMGVVYRATDLRLGRPVALKLLSPELSGDARFRARFERESHLAASIDHAGIIPVYEAGDADGLLPYISKAHHRGGPCDVAHLHGGPELTDGEVSHAAAASAATAGVLGAACCAGRRLLLAPSGRLVCEVSAPASNAGAGAPAPPSRVLPAPHKAKRRPAGLAPLRDRTPACGL